MRRSSALRGGVAALALAAALAAAAQAAGALQVRVGQAADFSRLEFQGLGKPSSSRNGQVLTLSFGADAAPDMSLLHLAPPRWLKDAAATHAGGHLQIALTLADDADANLGSADGSTFINLFAKGTHAPADNAPVKPVAAPPAPVAIAAAPAGGVVKVAAKAAGDQMQLQFGWRAPAPAAVFRRGDAIWVVFGVDARLDISSAPAQTSQYSKIVTLAGPGWTALRITAPAGVEAAAYGQDSSWTVALSSKPGANPTPILVSRDQDSAAPALTAVMAGARTPLWVTDPGVGDKMLVVPALGPAKGLGSKRDFVEMTFLATSQGLAIEPHVDDLAASSEGDLVHLGRPSGLALSSTSAVKRMTQQQVGPRAADLPGLFDPAWTAAPADFMPRYQAMMTAAAQEAVPGPNAPVVAQMSLARFLVGNDLDYEAIGLLDKMAKDHPTLSNDGEFRGLRGMAKAMVGRFDQAEIDLSAPALASDPAAAQWRGYVAVQARRWDDATKLFQAGQSAETRFPAVWRATFARAAAEAALNQNDYATAGQKIALALDQGTPPADQLKTRLLQARLMQQTGDSRALAVFEAVGRAPDDSVAAPALMHATALKLAAGKISAAEAASTYDFLRFRWRGDSTELEVVRALGSLYIAQGQYRQALETYVTAKNILPDDPVSVQIQNDGAAAFRALFLNGGADGLQPIQALGLFQDFQSFTPVGPDGDQMVRMMASRLVQVDLLPQAAYYLKYQVDSRLDGVPKAQVSTDLAKIYLMNCQPEQALDAINSSRTTVLPMALNMTRRELSARALIDLGRLDDAAELLKGDTSPDAQDLVADMAWRQRAWTAAGPLFEKRLGDRWKNPAPLNASEEGELLRAGVAFSLAGDSASLKRLQTRYTPYFDKASNPDALKVIFTDADPAGLSLADYGRVAADDAVFQGWVDKMRQQLRNPVKPAQQAANSVPATKG